MAIHKRHKVTIIKRNGHLIVTGDETTEELNQALLYLRSHTVNKCYQPHAGIPIESLIPDVSVLTVKSTRSKNAKTQNVIIKHGRL